jgi:hypothetical protein
MIKQTYKSKNRNKTPEEQATPSGKPATETLVEAVLIARKVSLAAEASAPSCDSGPPPCREVQTQLAGWPESSECSIRERRAIGSPAPSRGNRRIWAAGVVAWGGVGSFVRNCWHRSARGRLRRTVARKSASRLWPSALPKRSWTLWAGPRRISKAAATSHLASGIGNWDQSKHTTCRGWLIWENPTYSAFWSVFGATCLRWQRLASSVGSGRTARLAPRKNLADSDVRSDPGGCYVRREGPGSRTSARSGRWCGRQPVRCMQWMAECRLSPICQEL